MIYFNIIVYLLLIILVIKQFLLKEKNNNLALENEDLINEINSYSIDNKKLKRRIKIMEKKHEQNISEKTEELRNSLQDKEQEYRKLKDISTQNEQAVRNLDLKLLTSNTENEEYQKTIQNLEKSIKEKNTLLESKALEDLEKKYQRSLSTIRNLKTKFLTEKDELILGNNMEVGLLIDKNSKEIAKLNRIHKKELNRLEKEHLEEVEAIKSKVISKTRSLDYRAKKERKDQEDIVKRELDLLVKNTKSELTRKKNLADRQIKRRKNELEQENAERIAEELERLGANYVLNELPFDISVNSKEATKDKFLLRRERDKINKEKEELKSNQEKLEKEKQSILLKQQAQEIENKKSEIYLEVQNKLHQNKEILHKTEKKELEMQYKIDKNELELQNKMDKDKLEQELHQVKFLHQIDSKQFKGIIDILNQENKNKTVLHSIDKERLQIQIDHEKMNQKALKQGIENKETLHLVEKERLRLAFDEQQGQITSIREKYDATIEFMENKMQLLKLIETNRGTLHKQQIENLQHINKQERLVAQEVLAKEQTQQLVYNAQKEKEIAGMVHKQTDNLRRITKQVTDLQNDKVLLNQEVQFHKENESKLKYLEQMIKVYGEVKKERLNIVEANVKQLESFLSKEYFEQKKWILDDISRERKLGHHDELGY
ncbi:MAG: hypothetical protein N4A45_03260 [Flavobacteriales bacterium]|jgi:hypothetical protein|nr:hypothetical protein [Flavobacteriales bacterium]